MAIFLGLHAGEVCGEVPEPMRARCSWWPPVAGSPPVTYQLQIQDPRALSDFDTTYVVSHVGGAERVRQAFDFLDGDFWEHYRARVRAVDAMGRVGPWSPWSEVVVFEIPDPEP